MKTVVSLQELVNAEIRPGRLIEEFRELTGQAVAALAAGSLAAVPCPCCDGDASSPAFEKLGLTYRQCDTCGSLFVSPRPSPAALAEYYRSSLPAVFWRERLLRETLATRRAKLARPRAEWVVDGLTEHLPHAADGIDVSPHGALLIEELRSRSPALRDVRSAAEALDEVGAPASADFVTAFDTLDRVADVAAFVHKVHAALRPGGMLFVAAPCISGFDLQVLWDRSPTILPPDKLNLLSIDGFSRLFRPPRWNIIELSTPGMFDVENVRQAIASAPEAGWPRVIRELVGQRDEHARMELQEYLQRHRLASFARLMVRRD